MRTEAELFAGVSAFFGVTALGYGVASQDPAGTAVLTVAFLMAVLVTFYLAVQYRKRGPRAQDRKDAEVADAAGPLDFFPSDSPWPIVVAGGFCVAALGVVFGVWLLLLGLGVLGMGVYGMVFEHAVRHSPAASSPETDVDEPR
jgi:membrane protein implicated in regulation of membrane protease activity